MSAQKQTKITEQMEEQAKDDTIILATPPRTATARLPIRTPERPRPRRGLSPEDSPELLRAPPASTAPSKLEGGRNKRKRKHTSRYEKAVKEGLLAGSQHKAGGGRGNTTP